MTTACFVITHQDGGVRVFGSEKSLNKYFDDYVEEIKEDEANVTVEERSNKCLKVSYDGYYGKVTRSITVKEAWYSE